MNKKPSLSIILPAYNEEENIESAILKTLEYAKKNTSKYEIIVVNDGSKDNTEKIIKRVKRLDKNIKLITHKKNKGFGEAEKTGLRNSNMDFITLVPTDHQFDIKELNKYFLLFEQGADIVMGVRKHRKDPFIRIVYSKVYGFFIFLLFGMTWYGDLDWVKVYRKKVINSIKITSTSAFVDAEIIIRSYKKGYKIKEVWVKHYPRKRGKAAGVNIKVIIRSMKELLSFWFRYMKNKNEKNHKK